MNNKNLAIEDLLGGMRRYCNVTVGKLYDVSIIDQGCKIQSGLGLSSNVRNTIETQLKWDKQ